MGLPVAGMLMAGGSLLGGLLGGKGKEAGPEVTPWADTVEPWQYDHIKRKMDLTGNMREKGADVQQWLAENPAVLSGMSDEEIQALEGRYGALEGFQNYADAGTEMYGDGTYMGDMLANPEASLEGVYDRYENPYTEDVVDTTLAGMDRKAWQEQVARGGQETAAGAGGNSRAGVADAIAQNLHGMNRGEMEATLRSDAFDTSRQFGMDEVGMVGNLTGDAADRYLNTGNQLFDAANMYYDDLGEYGEESRKIGDINRESARTTQKDSLGWYQTLFGEQGNGPVSGVTNTAASSPGWAQGLGAGADLASAYLKYSNQPAATGG